MPRAVPVPPWRPRWSWWRWPPVRPSTCTLTAWRAVPPRSLPPFECPAQCLAFSRLVAPLPRTVPHWAALSLPAMSLRCTGEASSALTALASSSLLTPTTTSHSSFRGETDFKGCRLPHRPRLPKVTIPYSFTFIGITTSTPQISYLFKIHFLQRLLFHSSVCSE